MLGLGETREEVLHAMEEIAAQGTHILTLGQYMQPTPEHLPIERYVHPDEFAEFKRSASRWDSSTWKPGRWFARRITPSSRKKPRAADSLHLSGTGMASGVHAEQHTGTAVNLHFALR